MHFSASATRSAPPVTSLLEAPGEVLGPNSHDRRAALDGTSRTCSRAEQPPTPPDRRVSRARSAAQEGHCCVFADRRLADGSTRSWFCERKKQDAAVRPRQRDSARALARWMRLIAAGATIMLGLRCLIPSTESPTWTSPAARSSCGVRRRLRTSSTSSGTVMAHVRSAEDAAQNSLTELDEESAST